MEEYRQSQIAPPILPNRIKINFNKLIIKNFNGIKIKFNKLIIINFERIKIHFNALIIIINFNCIK